MPVITWHLMGPTCQAVFTFDLRSISSSGLGSDFTECTVSNIPPASVAPGDINPVSLQVAGWRPATTGDELDVIGPTNLAISASVNLPNVTRVAFYADGAQIGAAYAPPFQMTWFHVPGATHEISAIAISQNSPLESPNSYYSDPVSVKVTVKLEPEAYQTSATDGNRRPQPCRDQPGRSYSSRMWMSGVLGTGWTALWGIGKVHLSSYLENNWFALTQLALTGDNFYITETAAHFATVTLPSGQSIGFAAQLNIGGFPQPAIFCLRMAMNVESALPVFHLREWTIQCQDSENNAGVDL